MCIESEFGPADKSVMMVGDTEADLEFAKNIGATGVWLACGHGDRGVCEPLADVVVDSAMELRGMIEGLA